jgi:hypothetical protein
LLDETIDLQKELPAFCAFMDTLIEDSGADKDYFYDTDDHTITARCEATVSNEAEGQCRRFLEVIDCMDTPGLKRLSLFAIEHSIEGELVQASYTAISQDENDRYQIIQDVFYEGDLQAGWLEGIEIESGGLVDYDLNKLYDELNRLDSLINN